MLVYNSKIKYLFFRNIFKNFAKVKGIRLYCKFFDNIIWPISDYTFFFIFIDHKVLIINLEPLLVGLFFVLVWLKTNSD